MKERILVIDYPIYSYKLNVILSKSIVKSRNKRVKKIGDTYIDAPPQGLFSWKEDEFESFMFLEPDTDVEIIAHESFHFITRLFDRIGSSLNEGSEEIYAYNLGDVVKKIYNFVKDNKGKFK